MISLGTSGADARADRDADGGGLRARWRSCWRSARRWWLRRCRSWWRACGPRRLVRPAEPLRVDVRAARIARYVAAGKATFVEPDDLVMAVAIGAEAVAYPIRQIGYHHVVNDIVGRQADRRDLLNALPHRSGVERGGRRPAADLPPGRHQQPELRHARRADRLVVAAGDGPGHPGPAQGPRLTPVPHDQVMFATWKAEQPAGRVLKLDEAGGERRGVCRGRLGRGRPRRYARDGAAAAPAAIEPRTLMVGITLDGRSKAWPHASVVSAGVTLDELSAPRCCC